MAVLLHLHHTHPYSSSRPISGQIPLSLPKFKIAFLLSGKVNFLKFRKKKLSFPYGICSGKSWKPSETDNKYVSSEPNETDVIKWEKDGEINECYHFKEDYFVHQRMTPFWFGSAVLVMANALMLTLPFEALAETCEADNSLFNMPLLLIVGLIGATVGGLLARERKAELRRLNDQLRQINAAFRRQAKVESYAPTLSYAPAVGRIPENEVIVDSRKHELISHLKSGKNCLRNQDPEKAYQEFKVALELAQSLKDPIEEKKAARGLGASLQRQRKYREAIKYHSMVLSISDREGEDSGNTEAYGAIADCYTELGDLERAGKFYDEYIAGKRLISIFGYICLPISRWMSYRQTIIEEIIFSILAILRSWVLKPCSENQF